MSTLAFKIFIKVIRPNQTEVSIVEETFRVGDFDLWSTYKMSYARWTHIHDFMSNHGYKIIEGSFSRIEV